MATHSAFFGYLLWLLLGVFGVHRFYFGKRASAVFFLLMAVVVGGGGAVYLSGTKLPWLAYLPIPLAVLGLAWLLDLFLVPGMKRDVAGRYQYGRYSYNVAWLWLVIAGVFGAHHFYLGNWKKGVLYLLTIGVFGLGVLYDYFTFNDTLSDRNERWISGESEFDSVPPRPVRLRKATAGFRDSQEW